MVAGTVEHQRVPDKDGGVVLVDMPAEPQLWLHFFDPVSDGEASAVTSAAEDITGPKGRHVGHHHGVSIRGELPQLILQLVLMYLAVGVEGREQNEFKGEEGHSPNGLPL